MNTLNQRLSNINLIADEYIKVIDSYLIRNSSNSSEYKYSRQFIQNLRLQLLRSVYKSKELLTVHTSFEEKINLEIELQWLCNQCHYWMQIESDTQHKNQAPAISTTNNRIDSITGINFIAIWLIFRIAFLAGRIFKVYYYTGLISWRELYGLWWSKCFAYLLEVRFSLRYWKIQVKLKKQLINKIVKNLN